MGNRQKPVAWRIFARGTLLSLGVYLGLTALTALLLSRGILPERGAFPAVAVSCAAAAITGGRSCVSRSPWGKLASGAMAAACFCAVLVAGGLTGESGIAWLGRGGILLACAAAGGLLAGGLGGRQGRRVRRKSVHRGKAPL